MNLNFIKNNTNILYFIFGLILMFCLIEIRNNCWISNDVKQYQNKIIKKLLRQTARWSTAATQDESPLIAVLHAYYGTGYLWALKDIASNKDIKTATNVDMTEFEKHVVSIQDSTTKNLSKVCPEFSKTDNEYLARIGGEL